MARYIGARYVPKFLGTHDSTIPYEALSVVDNGAGTTYISRVPVPANIALTNTTYWLVYGASSGAILDLQNRMQTAENDIDSIESDLGDIETDITGLGNRLTTAENDIVNIESIVGRRFILLADSFGNIVDRGANTWIEFFKNILDVSGSQCYSSYSSSGGFVASGHNGTYLTQLQNLTVADKDTITDIVVQTAGNDYNSNADAIITALTAFCSYVRSNFPIAKIHIAFTNKTNTALPTVAAAIQTTLKKVFSENTYLGYHYIPSMCYAMIPLSATDGTHPTESASKVLAGKIINGILDGDCSTYDITDYAHTFTGADSASHTINFRRLLKDNMLTVELRDDFVQVFNGSQTMNALNYSLGSISNGFLRSLNTKSISVPVQVNPSVGDHMVIGGRLTFSYNSVTGNTDLKLTSADFGSRTVEKVYLWGCCFSMLTDDVL